jgi:hypothetical protein
MMSSITAFVWRLLMSAMRCNFSLVIVRSLMMNAPCPTSLRVLGVIAVLIEERSRQGAPTLTELAVLGVNC